MVGSVFIFLYVSCNSYMRKIFYHCAIGLTLATVIGWNANAQIITTIAGNVDSASSLGDGGLATAAGIQGPSAVARDAAGNLYIAEQYGNRIRKVNAATGIVTTIAGNGTAGYSGNGGPATNASINDPMGIAVDTLGNVYFSDFNNNCVRKISTSGIITVYAGTASVSGYTGDGGQATAAKLISPVGLAYDRAGNLYIADNGNTANCVRKVAASGIITTIAGTGTPGFGGDGGPATAALLHFPEAVTTDKYGNIFIADCNNYRIRKINTSGIITTVAGSSSSFSGDGGAATLAKLHHPTGIAVDTNGILFISDNDSNKIRKVYKTGIIYTLAGNDTAGYAGDGGIATAAELQQPYGVIVDDANNAYIADNFNNVVRKVTPFYNHRPLFANGNLQHFSVCQSSTFDSLGNVLKVIDSDGRQFEHWSLLVNPTHGTIAATDSIWSTSFPLTPSGLYYTPTTGYTGLDTFKVVITDGIDFDTTLVAVSVDVPLAGAGAIVGLSGTATDSLCPGLYDNLSDSIVGGTWTISDTTLATVNASTGVVHSVNSGTDTVFYTIANGCNTVIAQKIVVVKTLAQCFNVGTENVTEQLETLQLFPNPNGGSFNFVLKSPNDADIDVTITDMSGRTVKHFTAPTNTQLDVALDNNAVGVYFLTCKTASGMHSVKFAVVQ
jgi:Secretion system C-terminal sorting domain